MRALMRSLAPTLRRRRRPRRAVPAGADGGQHAQRLRRPQERPASRSTYLHPDAEEVLGRHLRADDLPGVGDAGRAEVRRLLPGRGRQPAQGLRQEDPRADGQGAGQVRRRVRGHRLRRASSARSCSTSSSRFADYAFNKSHAFGYGLVAYQTAYLKAHYPVEYLACLLTSVKANLDKAAVYLAECRAMGIEVLVARRQPVGVRLHRLAAATPAGVDAGGTSGRSRSGCRRCATSARASSTLIVAEREANGPFADFYDFCERVDPSVLNKRSVESLIKAGGFDSLGHPRKGLLPGLRADHRRHPRSGAGSGTMGVMTLFGDLADDGDGFDERVADPRPRVRQGAAPGASRRRCSGSTCRDHPLMGAEASLRRQTDCTIAELAERRGRRRSAPSAASSPASSASGPRRATYGRVRPRGPAGLDRGDGLPEDDARARPQARRRRRRLRQGPRRQAGRDPKLIGMEIDAVRGHRRRPPRRCGSSCPPRCSREERIDRLKALLAEHPGESQVFLHLGEGKVLRLPDQLPRRPAPGGGRAAGRVRPRSRRPVADALSSSGHTSWGTLFRTPSGDGKMVTRRSSEPAALHRRTCRDAPGA